MRREDPVRYTDEQLSRILSAHEGRQLVRGGVCVAGCSDCEGKAGCINQVAEPGTDNGTPALRINRAWLAFDQSYDSGWDVDHLLLKIEEWTAL